MKKKKGTGLLLNILMPGLGQMYARRIAKGVLFYLLIWAVGLNLRIISYNPFLLLLALALYMGFYCYAVIMGHRDVDPEQEYTPSPFDKTYVYVLSVAVNWVLIFIVLTNVVHRYAPIDFAVIPTPAMSPSLEIGDKLAYQRIPSLQRNDVGIFRLPREEKTLYIKRCVAIPGDTLVINDGFVFINGAPEQTDATFKYSYRIDTDGSPLPPKILASINLTSADIERHIDYYQLFITDEQAQSLADMKPYVQGIERDIRKKEAGTKHVYPWTANNTWNQDFFGPFYLPKKEDILSTENPETIDLYLPCLQLENNQVEWDYETLTVNGQSVTEYVFKENYYFMMGDNRHNSLDSRYLGPIPESRLVGEALYLYWAENPKRIWKKIL